MNMLKNKDNQERIDLNKVISYRKGIQSYPTGFFGLGKIRTYYLIRFEFEGNSESWSFNDEEDRDRAFRIIENITRPSEV